MASPDITIRFSAARAPAYLIGAAGFVAVLGAFLPWVTLSAPLLGTISKNGIDGDGVFALGLGMVLVIYAVIRAAGVKLHWVVAIVVAIALFFLAAYEIVRIYRAGADLNASMRNDPNDVFGIGAAIASATSISVGFGLWLEALTSLIAITGGILMFALAPAKAPVATAHRPYPVQGNSTAYGLPGQQPQQYLPQGYAPPQPQQYPPQGYPPAQTPE